MDVQIIKSDRRTLAIEVKGDMTVVVRAPKRLSNKVIQSFVEEKTPWINKALEKMAQRAQGPQDPPLTKEELAALTDRAKRTLPPLVQEWARQMGQTVGRVSIRHQSSRWGSCSAKGNISLNCLLLLCPPAVMEYVIIHELCHLKHLNHSGAFWAMVESYCPDYKEYKDWLKANGRHLIKRLKGEEE